MQTRLEMHGLEVDVVERCDRVCTERRFLLHALEANATRGIILCLDVPRSASRAEAFDACGIEASSNAVGWPGRSAVKSAITCGTSST